MTVQCKKCGRDVDIVIGTFGLCPVCDRPAVPKHVEPEKTQPLYVPNWSIQEADVIEHWWLPWVQ